MFSFKKSKFENPALNPNASEIEVNNWVISTFVIEKLVPKVGIHPFPLNELMLMSSAVCCFKPAHIFEWGTNVGKSARIFYETIKSFHISSHIHSIDLPDDVFHNEHPQKNRGKLVRDLKEVTLHQADGLAKSLEIYNSEKVTGNVLFFIDGDHSYECVKRELATILEHIPTAKVLLHDTFYQSADANYNIGSFKAIEDVLGSAKNEYNVITTNLGLPGMTLLYKKSEFCF